MNTDLSSYKYVNRNEDVLPLCNVSAGDKRSTPVEYVVCSDCVDGKGKTLNKEYRAGEDVRRISPEIGVYQIEGVEDALESGRILIQVVHSRGNVVGEREADIGELGHTIQPGYGIVPFVSVDDGVAPRDVDEIRVFVVSE